MANLSAWRVFWAGILFAVLAQVVHSAGAFLTMGYYTMPQYLQVWSKIMMPSAGPPPASFYVYSLVFGIVSGVLFALVYGIVRSSVPGNTSAKKGITYGLLVFLVGGIPGYLALLLLVNLPSVLILYWAFESLVIYIIGGALVARIVK